MARRRQGSNASNVSSMPERDQELGSMYDYLAKIILLGPSGCGKSCLLHRFLKNEWRTLTSQTIGVEFASKIIRVGTGTRRQRIKLQLWDTAGTERFRSVSRSYYRGAAGAILVYDLTSEASFNVLPTFLHDARALASPQLTVLLAGNKSDVAEVDGREEGVGRSLLDTDNDDDIGQQPGGSKTILNTTSSPLASATLSAASLGTSSPPPSYTLSSRLTSTIAPQGREVSSAESSRWASTYQIPVAVEVSAYDGSGVDELFARLARMILTKIELGEIDPDDPASGIQYGDGGGWEDAGSVRSGRSNGSGGNAAAEGSIRRRGKRKGAPGQAGGWREWEEVFRLDGTGRRRRGGCC